MKSWKTPTPEQVEKAIALIVHPQQSSYFFNHLQNPKWISPLKKRDVFKNPPQAIRDSSEGTVSFPAWAESSYLARMAQHEPKAVLEIAIHTETENPRIHRDFVEAALQMPPEEAMKMVAKVKTWIESPYSSFALLPDKVGALIVHLAKGGQVKKALDLARSLLVVMPDPSTQNGEANEDRAYRPRPEPRTHFDNRSYNWEYEQILKKYVPELVTIAGESALQMLGYLLYDAVKFSQHPRERNQHQENSPIWEDRSMYWRPAIEEHPRNRTPHGVAELLAIALRDAAEQIVESNPSKMRSLVLTLEKWHWRVFHRIALYLIRKYPDNDRKLLTERLVDQKRFSNSSEYEDYEYVFLVKEYFGSLPEEEQEKIFGWIENPNFDLSWWEDQERRAKWVKYWQLNKLTPIKDSLPAKWQQQYQQLVKECGTTVDIPDIVFGGVGETKFVGAESPKTDSELASMSIEELLSFLRTWQPSSRDPFEPRPSISGVGFQLSRLAEQNPERFALAAEQFQELHLEYCWNLVRGVRSALANNKGQQGELKEFSWSSVLKLCSWIVQESQPSPECETTDDSRDSDLREARRAVADLLRVGFAARGNSGIPLHFRSEVWNIIEPLTHDPDPTPEREKGYSTPTDKSPRDLSDLSINTVRGEAMHTVVRYALWLRRHFEQMPDGSELIGRGFNEMPEVRQVFNEHLDLDRDTSLAIRSVYGQWFPWLMMLDGGWATQNVAKIFPHDEALSDLRSAAWESYIRYCSVYDNVFDLLQEEYNYAVERSNTACSKKQQLTELEEGLAEHLMTFYWRGKLRLDEPRGLLTLFYTEVPDVFRGYALEFVGRSLRNTEDAIEPQILNRLQLLWERRLEAARAATLPTSYINELAAFGWWFASAKFDDSWAIAQLKEVLQLIGQVEPDFLIFERLAALADKMPESTVECLKLIIEKDKNGLGIYGSDDEVKTILATAIQGSSDTARQTAIELINRLGQCGNWEFRELLSIES